MPLTIEFLDGSRQGDVLEFGDHLREVRIGRNEQFCQVVFPPDATAVSREHCIIRNKSSQWWLEVPPDKAVEFQGSIVEHHQKLNESQELRIGPDGPRIKVLAQRTSASNLEATVAQGITAEKIRILESAPASSLEVKELDKRQKSTAKTAFAAVFVGAVSMVGAYFLFDTLEQDLRSSESMLQARMSAADQSLKNKFNSVQNDLADLGAGLSDSLEKAKESVYLMVWRGNDGREEPFGTCWVVDEGRLATNAHVARKFLTLGPGEDLIARQANVTNGTPIDHRIDGVEFHPGYDSFSRLWSDFQPAIISPTKDVDFVKAAGSACDIAIMTLANSEGLAKPLPLASTLEAGQPIGFVGFPIEGLAMQGVNVKRPVSTSQDGRVTSVTTFFNTIDLEINEGTHNTLIQHNLPATGGASGSPLFNRFGEVVGILNAVNFVIIGEQRIPSGAGINFGQHVSLIQEMIDESKISRHTERVVRWEESISNLYSEGKLVRRELELDGLIAQWRQLVGQKQKEVVEVSADQVAHATIMTNDVSASRPVRIVVRKNGNYLLAAFAKEEISLDLNESELLDNSMEMVVGKGLKTVMINANDDGVITANISGTGSDPVWRLYEARIDILTPNEIHKRLVQEWLSTLEEEEKRASEVEFFESTIQEQHPDFKAPFNSKEIVFEKPGDYLVLATSLDRSDIDLRMLTKDDNDDKVEGIDADESTDWYPFVPIKIERPMSLKAEVLGAKENTPFKLAVYRAEDMPGFEQLATSLDASAIPGATMMLRDRFGSLAAAERGIDNGAWWIAPEAVGMSSSLSSYKFRKMTSGEVKKKFENYLKTHSDLVSKQNIKVVIDASPQISWTRLGRYLDAKSRQFNPARFIETIKALKIRLDIVKELLPNHQLGCSGVIEVNPWGSSNKAYVNQLKGIRFAGGMGAFDSLDFISPNLYQQWGPIDKGYRSVNRYFARGGSDSQQVARSDKTSIPVIPLLSFEISNKRSRQNGQLVTDQDLVKQAAVLKRLGLQEFIFADVSGSMASAEDLLQKEEDDNNLNKNIEGPPEDSALASALASAGQSLTGSSSAMEEILDPRPNSSRPSSNDAVVVKGDSDISSEQESPDSIDPVYEYLPIKRKNNTRIRQIAESTGFNCDDTISGDFILVEMTKYNCIDGYSTPFTKRGFNATQSLIDEGGHDSDQKLDSNYEQKMRYKFGDGAYPVVQAPAREVTGGSIEYLALDWEYGNFEILEHEPIGSEIFNAMVEEMAMALKKTKEMFPRTKVGYYGLPLRCYWTHKCPDYQERCEAMLPIFREADWIAPAVYNMYKAFENDEGGPDRPAAPQQNLDYLERNVAIAIDLAQRAGDKECLIYSTHRFHVSNDNHCLRLVDFDEWEFNLKKILNVEYGGKRVDGLIWWGGDDWYKSNTPMGCDGVIQEYSMVGDDKFEATQRDVWRFMSEIVGGNR